VCVVEHSISLAQEEYSRHDSIQTRPGLQDECVTKGGGVGGGARQWERKTPPPPPKYIYIHNPRPSGFYFVREMRVVHVGGGEPACVMRRARASRRGNEGETKSVCVCVCAYVSMCMCSHVFPRVCVCVCVASCFPPPPPLIALLALIAVPSDLICRYWSCCDAIRLLHRGGESNLNLTGRLQPPPAHPISPAPKKRKQRVSCAWRETRGSSGRETRSEEASSRPRKQNRKWPPPWPHFLPSGRLQRVVKAKIKYNTCFGAFSTSEVG